MPEEETPKTATVTAEEEPIVDAVDMNKPQTILESADNAQAIAQITARIDEAQNILVALSNDPSVDEIAAAIGLAIALDKVGKRATAIYSGVTPNVLEFLEPNKTLDDNPDVLQDLIIALNKDKADHLRYKVDGDYVKIFVTPYKTKLVPEDFDYSYGDYNVELVIALDVHTATDLDGVLREHGRIMHDASAINITTGAPGRFADTEWSNVAMSSVSEMVAELLLSMQKLTLDAEVATPLLAGIVGATERFKNEHTTSNTMAVAGRLMEAGANVQLVAENIAGPDGRTDEPLSGFNIDLQHEDEMKREETAPDEAEELDEQKETEEVAEEENAEAGLGLGAGGAAVNAPLLNEELMEELRRQQEATEEVPEEPVQENVKDYGKMIDEALAELNAAAPQEPAMETLTPADGAAGIPEGAMSQTASVVGDETQGNSPEMADAIEPLGNLAENAGPTETQGAAELPMPGGDGVLPPPPTPNVNFDAIEMPEAPVAEVPATPEVMGAPEVAGAPEIPEMPEVQMGPMGNDAPTETVQAVENVTPENAQPEPQAAAAAPAPSVDSTEFKIPGM